MAKHVVVTLETTSGQPEDRIVNTFAFLGGELADTAELDALIGRVEDFYTAVPAGGAFAVAAYLSPEVVHSSSTVHRIAVYDVTGQLNGQPHGSPEREALFAMPTAVRDNQPLPQELAIKIRFEGAGRSTALVETNDGTDPGSAPDRPRQRLTGGVYIGPLNLNALDAIITPTSFVSPDAQGDFKEAAEDLAAPVPTVVGTDFELAVWSRQAGTMTTLESVSVDNAFDIIRKRGRKATATFRSPV